MLLHSIKEFCATQKGQVSVPRNCELELISDQHWYWWFVKVSSNGLEGFVPAEILERPSERLARLNSNLNVKMSAEPLKLNTNKALKKRKSVRFSAILFTTDQDRFAVPELDSSASPTSSDESDSDTISSPEQSSVLDDDASWAEAPETLKKRLANEGHDTNIENRITVQAL